VRVLVLVRSVGIWVPLLQILRVGGATTELWHTLRIGAVHLAVIGGGAKGNADRGLHRPSDGRRILPGVLVSLPHGIIALLLLGGRRGLLGVAVMGRNSVIGAAVVGLGIAVVSTIAGLLMVVGASPAIRGLVLVKAWGVSGRLLVDRSTGERPGNAGRLRSRGRGVVSRDAILWVDRVGAGEATRSSVREVVLSGLVVGIQVQREAAHGGEGGLHIQAVRIATAVGVPLLLLGNWRGVVLRPMKRF